jgi:hypothetical protein
MEYRWEGDYERAPALAADLVRRQVTVIVTGALPPRGGEGGHVINSNVFIIGSDPIRAGLAARSQQARRQSHRSSPQPWPIAVEAAAIAARD